MKFSACGVSLDSRAVGEFLKSIKAQMTEHAILSSIVESVDGGSLAAEVEDCDSVEEMRAIMDGGWYHRDGDTLTFYGQSENLPIAIARKCITLDELLASMVSSAPSQEKGEIVEATRAKFNPEQAIIDALNAKGWSMTTYRSAQVPCKGDKVGWKALAIAEGATEAAIRGGGPSQGSYMAWLKKFLSL